ncbi:efflux transporter, RND family, MFP subunit [Opitutus terrae PB90-1]|uniref:Efflux transporter, RND family, MFP subunit n=2 Tax=Opitutus terrae TaxID=107709 RepID=B1ZUN7_OPITP|nr:efflux transporter, RND family, MFP subunit [Opitutus terrae PB90-1]
MTSALPASQPASAAPRKKSRMKWIILAAVVLIIGLGVAAKFASANRQQGALVVTEKAVVKTITQLVNATGKIQPEVEVKISPEVSGEIIELPLREGAVVKKGDLLVRIKPDNYVYQVEQQEANLTAAKATAVQSKAQLLKAEEDFKRSDDLFKKQLISDSDFTAIRTSLEVAQANYDNALAQIRRTEGLLNQSRELLSKTTIYAPMDGTISSLTSEIGERVVATGSFAGTEVMRVANLNDMEARVNVNENDVVNVKIGDKARITIDAYPGRKFVGTVKEISSAAKTQGLNTQEEITNFLVKVRVGDKDVSIRPGMSANVDIETKTVENVVAVPIQSVTVRSREGNKTIDELSADREKKAKETQGDGAATAVNEKQQRDRERTDREGLQRVVFLRTGDTVKMVSVETGIADTTHMEIKSGLKEGDEVVTGPFSTITRTLKDGAKIRLDKPKPAAGADKAAKTEAKK